MMKICRLSSALWLVMVGLLLSGNCFAVPDYASLTKKRVLSDLDSIHNIFEVKYAPLKWKGEFADWDLGQAVQEAREKISVFSTPSLKECQVVIRDFFNSTRDYHVGVRFYSTESASLPFLIKGAQQRYFVCAVDRSQLSKGQFPFEEGDEILTFDHRPIHEVIEELRTREFGSNTYATDLALAEMALTNRNGTMGEVIPQGSVVITGRKKGENKEIAKTLRWHYVPEKIRDFSKLGHNIACQASPLDWRDSVQTAIKKSQFFDKFMVFHKWEQSYVGASTQVSHHTLGSRSSYLPPLGKVLWRTGIDWFFDAYIFQTPSKKRIGYIRISHYMADEEEFEEFGSLIEAFQNETDALVIDQLNNPGGSVFYLYALASALTDTPLYAPKHHIAVTQEEVHKALFILQYLEQVKDDTTAKEVLGEVAGGYEVDYKFACLMKEFCHFIIDQWNEGKLYTEPTHLFGVDKIQPHSDYQYKKPILLLINSLNFSGGDFFPAILQDNKRATLMGTRTAGAGGYVLNTAFPNHSGIKSFVLTGSLAERIDKRPIENLGVQPDIVYELTVEDLQANYQPYVNAIVERVESLIK